MRKFTMIAAAMMVILSSSAVFAAQSPTAESKMAVKAEMHPSADASEFGIFRHLSLTEPQKKEMRELMKGTIASHKAAMQEYREAVHKLITDESFDEAAARDAIGKMDSVRIDEIKMHQQMYSMLTPDQKKEYAKAYQEMSTRMSQRMEKKVMKMEKLQKAQ
ncbi:MAG: Spy/CpxP family protein refolding chaperone [Enterobacteriaceae bacterium]